LSFKDVYSLLRFQCFVYLGSEVLHRKRLLDKKMLALFQYAVMRDHVGRVAGNKQPPDGRIDELQAPGQIPSVMAAML
jgi:hypothetical protein